MKQITTFQWINLGLSIVAIIISILALIINRPLVQSQIELNNKQLSPNVDFTIAYMGAMWGYQNGSLNINANMFNTTPNMTFTITNKGSTTIVVRRLDVFGNCTRYTKDMVFSLTITPTPIESGKSWSYIDTSKIRGLIIASNNCSMIFNLDTDVGTYSKQVLLYT